MNTVILTGRLARDVEIRGEGDHKVSNFTIASDRWNSKEKKNDADFIRCVAFGRQGENIAKYFAKGSPILVQGSIRTGSYKKNDGTTVYTTEVYVSRFEFMGKNETTNSNNNSSGNRTDGDDIPSSFEAVAEDIPF